MPTIAEVRAQYPDYSDLSDVQLAGALHDKFYPDMDPNAFAEKIGLKPDKYQQAAIDEKAPVVAIPCSMRPAVLCETLLFRRRCE